MILIQAFNEQLQLLHEAVLSDTLTPDDVVAYLDSKLGEANWLFYSAPELEAAE